MAKITIPATIDSLLAQGGGVLNKRGNVWTYPGAPNDPSGTNLKIPLESVTDAMVQEALTKGDLVANVHDSLGGAVSVVRKPAESEAPVRLVNLAQAGTVEMGTEVPVNSRPTHDAGRRVGEVDPAVAQGKVDPKEAKPSGPIAPAVPLAVGLTAEKPAENKAVAK